MSLDPCASYHDAQGLASPVFPPTFLTPVKHVLGLGSLTSRVAPPNSLDGADSIVPGPRALTGKQVARATDNGMNRAEVLRI
jgi:hypothetical protein